MQNAPLLSLEDKFRSDVAPSPSWTLPELSGRLVELSGNAGSLRLTAAFGLVLEAQRSGEPAAWIAPIGSSFFPPDVAAGGVDLSALPVVRVPDARAAGLAADELLRSGAFGLVLVDLAGSAARSEIPVPLLTRLLGLCQTHHAALVFLTEKSAEAASLNPLISLRAEVKRGAQAPCTCEIWVLKDKRRGPGWTHREICRGPPGLR